MISSYASYLSKITFKQFFTAKLVSSGNNNTDANLAADKNYNTYLDYFNLIGVDENGQIIKFDFTNISYKTTSNKPPDQ